MTKDRLSGLTRTIVMNAELSPAPTVERVEIRRIHMPAGMIAGLHIHNGPVVGSIVEGSVAYQIEGEPVQILAPGDAFFEPEAVRIARFDALDTDVTFLAYFLLTTDQEPQLEFPTA
ncbi:hypothetical protein AB0N05_36810 [Nocardia sp. NPDC051030]|uniref:hypothetical protein n=1 Tax=Nocardia sp. NPDC051030 TaxID=3155162 RepID=UPI00343AFFF6